MNRSALTIGLILFGIVVAYLTLFTVDQTQLACSPCVKFPDHRENRGNFINIGPIVRYSALTQQSIGGKIP